MQTSQWDSLPVEKLNELLYQAQAIHTGLPNAGKERAKLIITHVRGLIQAIESDKRHRELQDRLSGMLTVLDRSEKLAGRFEQQMEKLLTVVEQQKLLAEKLDRQTTHLIRLTYVVIVLTIALFVVAFREIADSHAASTGRHEGPSTPLG
jgi:hypothetical protein